MILFILRTGGIISTDYQKVLLMYNPSTYETADVIGTYIYRAGILGGSMSYAAAVGLLMSSVSFLILWMTNTISRRLSEYALW